MVLGIHFSVPIETSKGCIDCHLAMASKFDSLEVDVRHFLQPSIFWATPRLWAIIVNLEKGFILELPLYLSIKFV